MKGATIAPGGQGGVGFEMGRVETDWGRAGWATWACWAVKKQSPSPSVWVGSVSPTRPEARRADPTLNMGAKSVKID